MKPVNSTFIQSMVAIMAIFLSVQLTYSQTCITCDNNNIKAGFGNAVNSAYSNQSILGNGNTTGRNNAVAIGTASQANWSHSYVFGSSSVTNGMHAYAIGSNAVAQSTSSFAIGNYAKSMFGNAHSIGNFTTSNQVGAYVFGLGISDVYPLINNTTNSLVIGFKSQYPTLFVSETASGNQSGRVGIGNVTDPQAKLHIRADAGEDASLLLEPTGVGTFGILKFADNAHSIKAKAGQNFIFSAPEGKSFVFENGRMGVGIENPQYSLEVNGDVNLTNGNFLINGQSINCGSGYWQGGSGNDIYFNAGNVAIGGTTANATFQVTGNMNIGNNPTGTTGINAFVGGKNSIASGNYSFAFGENVKATMSYAFAGGRNTEANNLVAIALGYEVRANATGSVAIGNFVETGGGTSVVIGSGYQTNRLANNIPSSLMIGFKSTLPTFFVSESSGMNATGKIGIGNVTDPQTKLHIRADAGEDADILLEPGGEDQTALLRLGQNNSISAKDGSDMHFETTADKAFVFHQGDIFLEDIQSGIIMKSPNGQCWRGTLNDQGTLNFAQTTCPEGTSTAVQSHNSDKLMLVYPNPASHSLSVETRLSGRQGTLAVLSAAGFRLSEQSVNTGKTIVQLEAYAAGTYILQLEIDGQVAESTKFVKK